MSIVYYPVTCRMCAEDKLLILSNTGYINWKFSGALVQNAFPELSDADRELLISGTCGSCFDKLFPAENEE